MRLCSAVFPLIFTSFVGLILILSACMSPSSESRFSSIEPTRTRSMSDQELYFGTATAGIAGTPTPLPGRPAKEPSELLREVKVYKDLIPKGTHARKTIRPMKPRYITIHSTQNYSVGADAWRHSLAQKNGKLRAYKRKGGNRIGYLSWHYSIDQSVVVQHIPTNEQGEHADFDGPGNNYSIGLEMCENRGNDREITLDRTAKLTAYLMHQHNIPIYNVVPHYHWERKGLPVPHKNCPHFLLEDGRPGKIWRAFQAKIQKYYDEITVIVPITPTMRPLADPTVISPTVPQSSGSGYMHGY